MNARPRPLRRLGRRVAYALGASITAICVLIGTATVVGRLRLWPVRATAAGVHVSDDALLVLVPTRPASVKAGDLVVVAAKRSNVARVYEVTANLGDGDATVEVRDEHGDSTALRLPHTTWRVSRTVPAAGAALGVLPGSVVAPVLILAGVALLVGAQLHRRRDHAHGNDG